jgi:ribonuclease VapC
LIAVDSSALLAVAFQDAGWQACFDKLDDETVILVSAVALTETMIVAASRGVLATMQQYLASLELTPAPADGEAALRVAEIYRRWGKGYHAARLNIVDCFSYDVAHHYDCPLLYIGNDFSQTDIPSALA